MARITETKLSAAIEDARGNVSGVARRLGVSRQAAHEAVERHGLGDAVREARALRVERAEDVLDRAVDKQAPWAVALTLKCLGKHLGYVERIPDVAAAANLEALRRIVAHLGVEHVDEMALIEAVMEVKAEMDAERAG